MGILYFALLHYGLLVWNIREYNLFRQTETFAQLKKSQAEVQLMAIPLTYAMAINVAFVLGALFVPSLWDVVEYLFPLALAAYLAVGIYGVRIFMIFFARVIAFGDFDCEQNNSLSQMLSIFAFSMVAVGFAAPGAMSHNQLVSGLGIMLATAFSSVAAGLMLIKIVLGFRAMFEHGINRESAISLWIVIPILTVMGIALFRIAMGLEHNFGMHFHAWTLLLLFTVIVAMQVFYGILGYKVMRHLGYYNEFISGSGRSVIAYAAICPGVAFFVMGNFFINKGLVAAGVVDKFSPAYLVLYLPLVWVQLKTILVFRRLNRKLLRCSGAQADECKGLTA